MKFKNKNFNLMPEILFQTIQQFRKKLSTFKLNIEHEKY